MKNEVEFKTIKEIKEHIWIGNFHCDRNAFRAIEKFILDEKNSITDKAEAIRIADDKGMDTGRSEEKSDEELLKEYYTELCESGALY